MKWTTEQQKVIDYRDRNILVSAAAGSGKTAVLVERIIQRITDSKRPTDIDKLLVVTFTKAAAAEMRERIGSAIEKRMEEFPEDENLKKQQTLIHNAQITTIDSFCLFVVRNHFEEIGLEPNFRIADTGELKLLEMDVLNEVFEAEYAKKSDSFLGLVDAYSDKRSNKAVKDMVAKIYNQSASNPWPKEWIAELSRPYSVTSKEELLETEWMKGIFTYVKTLLCEIPAKIEGLMDIAKKPDGPQKYLANLEQDLTLFEGVADINTFEELENFFATFKLGSLSAIRNFEGDVQKKEAVSSGRNAIKKDLEAIQKRYFSMPLDELLVQLGRMKPVAEELVRLALTYLAAVEEEKKKKHIMDFSDIEHAALRIFVDENTKELRPTAMEFKRQFDEIMIDEYQDSNQVQEEIMCAISRESEGENNMFMVGDVKQSIYRFRLARPELFMEKFATYDLEESKKQRIDLHKNFRSRNEVLDFTNDVFYKIMASDLGNVSYDDEAALYYGADYPVASNMQAEVLLYEQKPNAEEDRGVDVDVELDSLSNRQIEARMIAERILELKTSLKVTDKATGALRPLRNSDIVILLRSINGWGNDFAAVLEDCGIPAHVSTSTGYFSAMEVQTVLSFLKILDNPYQDIPMAAVLKSPIVGLSDEELADIAITKEVHSFAEAALKQMGEATEGKLYEFARLFTDLRKRIADTSIHQLLTMVLDETGYGDYVKALPAGAKRSANLAMLVEKAIAYEKTSYKGLFHFVRYIDQLQKYEVDFGEADVTGETEDVVRLMTIHKSKGLEFPVVFVAGITKKFNESDSRDKMAIHPDMGLGLDEITLSPRTKRSCLIRSEIAERIRRDNLGEELRVLYVALTRAKEKLILTGVVKNQESLYEKHKGNVMAKKPLSFSDRLKAKGYVDWIVPAVLSYPDKYKCTFLDASALVLAEAKQQAAKTLEKEILLHQIHGAEEAYVDEIKEQFNYVYPYKEEKERKSKYSVSEIKHASMVEAYDRMEGGVEVPEFIAEERESYVPDFAKDVSETTNTDGVNPGALKGTATHRVMECFDFAGFYNLYQEEQLESLTEEEKGKVIWKFSMKEMERMIEKELLTQEMADLVGRKALVTFLASDTAIRMAKAASRGDLFREKPFVMDYEGVLLQGIIDVFWIENQRIVLLDYKTDRVETEGELVARYETQLKLYADALQRIWKTQNINETESLIYSFRLNTTIPIE